jgi:urease gamma subunit
MTDGEDHGGDAAAMANRLRDENIKLFAIGVGTADGELIPTGNGYVKDAQGHVVKSSLNESLLEELASATGGFYVRSAPGDFGLDRIYKLGISPLQRGEQETRMTRVYEERFGWFAGAALLLLLAEALLSAPRAAVLLLLLCVAPRSEAAGWYDAYKAGDYTNALAQLNAEEDGKRPAVAGFNRGVVLYRMADFRSAETAFAEAAAQTTDRELKQKALYNRGTALLRAARVDLNDPEETAAGFESAAQALRQFEEALLLDPDDVHARKNFERTLELITTRRLDGARGLIAAAGNLLEEFKAKEAKENYESAKALLEPLLKDFAPDSREAGELMQRADRQLAMLAKAVEETRLDLADAKRFIEEYFYKEAADIMLDESKERQWAFGLDEELAQEFQQLIENNMNVINIIYPDNPLKP